MRFLRRSPPAPGDGDNGRTIRPEPVSRVGRRRTRAYVRFRRPPPPPPPTRTTGVNRPKARKTCALEVTPAYTNNKILRYFVFINAAAAAAVVRTRRTERRSVAVLPTANASQISDPLTGTQQYRVVIRIFTFRRVRGPCRFPGTGETPPDRTGTESAFPLRMSSDRRRGTEKVDKNGGRDTITYPERRRKNPNGSIDVNVINCRCEPEHFYR